LAQAPAQTPAPTAAPAPSKPLYKAEELDQMLAPIALYSDSLLAQVLMAATYPLEVVEAARWVKANPNQKGDAAVKAVDDKTWDVSVKSLVAFPQVLTMMSDKLEWTQKLGDAMLAQQKDVSESIQRLRKLAYDSGNLKTSDQQKVNVQPPSSGTPQVIVIEPAQPQSVYVPVYEPSWAYGNWPYPSYPPYYYPPYPGYGYGAPLLRGFMWGVGVAAAGSLFTDWNWGGGDVNINYNRAVNIDRNFNRDRNPGGRWQHQVDHRKGVAYRDAGTRDKFGKNVPGADGRRDFRGKDVAGRPGGPGGLDRPGGPGGQRPGAGPGGQRPGAGPGGGQRPGAGAGPGGGQRPGAGAGGGQRPGAGGPPGARPTPPQISGRGSGAMHGADRGGQRATREATRGRQSGGVSRGGGGGGRGGGGGGGRGGGGRR
jgi:hypothetical protein